MENQSYFQAERKKFHQSLLSSVLTIDGNGIPGNADKDQKSSVSYAKSIAVKLEAETGVRAAAQSSGNQFEQLIVSYLRSTFLNRMANFRR
jgi:hypothetical protein